MHSHPVRVTVLPFYLVLPSISEDGEAWQVVEGWTFGDFKASTSVSDCKRKDGYRGVGVFGVGVMVLVEE